MKLLKYIFLFLIYFSGSQDLIGYHLPYVDLGLSNFFCGTPFREDNGWYILQYAQYYNANKFFDGYGNLIPSSSDPFYKSWGGITSLTYQSNARFLNGRIAVAVGIPYFFSCKVCNTTLNLLSSGRGLGDLFAGMFLQWDPVEHNGRTVFQSNIGFLASFPTGKWVGVTDNIINPGNKLFFMSPYFAYTFFITPKLTFSGYIYYIFSGKNRATKIKPGSAIDLIYNVLYEVRDKLFFGFNGYFLQELQNDKLFGKSILKTKERVLGSGPGLLYKPSDQTYLAMHLYFESLARNRAQGTNLILRLVQLF